MNKELQTNQKEKIRNQMESALMGKTPKRALVEAGNFYGGEPIKDQHVLGLQLGIIVVEYLQNLGIQTKKAILIDNYHHAVGNGDVDHVAFSIETGFTPDQIIYEETFEEQARHLAQSLLESKKAKQDNQGKIRYKGNILIGDYNRVVCAAFETPIHMQKAKDNPNGLLVTILPSSYRSQQALVQKLLAELGEQIPTLVVFFDETGATEVETFNLDFLEY